MSQSESAKKHWLTVESTVLILRQWKLFVLWCYQERSHFHLKNMEIFWPRSSVGCLSCVWLCPSRLRKASGHGRACAGIRPVNPLRLDLTLLTWVNFWTCDQRWNRYLVFLFFFLLFFFSAVDFTLTDFGISEAFNEYGKSVVIEYISPGRFITSSH